MRRASLRRLVAQVIAQADGRRLGHIGADERDGSRARFVVGSRANEAKTEIKGGIKTFYSQDSARVFITREQGSVYLQSRLPVSKQINRAVQTIRASHALAGLWCRARRIRAFRAQRTWAPYTTSFYAISTLAPPYAQSWTHPHVWPPSATQKSFSCNLLHCLPPSSLTLIIRLLLHPDSFISAFLLYNNGYIPSE